MPFSPLIPARTLDAGHRTVIQVPADAVMSPGRGVQVAHMVPIGRERMLGAASIDGLDRRL